MRVLFILKKRSSYGIKTPYLTSGLHNSVSFTVTALRRLGVHAYIVDVVDGNDIDREIVRHRADIVIIEALWVTPEKLHENQRLHPNVSFYVHLHSHLPFLAGEGMAMKWLRQYVDIGIKIIANSRPAYEALLSILNCKQLIYLENVYLFKEKDVCHRHDRTLHVGCFGAIRPLKNQLLQALAAIKYAHEKKMFLYFHMNTTRVESSGQSVLKNLKQLFIDTPHAVLVETPWLEPEEFLRYLRSNIDIGLQVSLSETFNVVSADCVAVGLPIVVSREVSWTSFLSKADTDSIDSIVEHMNFAIKNKWLVSINQWLLRRHGRRAARAWYKFIHQHRHHC